MMAKVLVSTGKKQKRQRQEEVKCLDCRVARRDERSGQTCFISNNNPESNEFLISGLRTMKLAISLLYRSTK
jgi:hypothetical protein